MGEGSLESVIADGLERRFTGAVKDALAHLNADGVSWEDFKVRTYAKYVAALIMKHVEDRPVTRDDLWRLAGQ